MKFLASFLIWLLLWIPMAISGLVVVPILLICGWEGYTGPWGNSLYGKYGNGVTLSRSNAYLFLAVRNPCSNFGKHWLGVPPAATWPWLIDNGIIKYGWAASPDSRDMSRKFYFNPFRWTH